MFLREVASHAQFIQCHLGLVLRGQPLCPLASCRRQFISQSLKFSGHNHPRSLFRAFKCSSNKRSAVGTNSSYRAGLPALSPPMRRIAVRRGSNAYRTRSKLAPDLPLSSFMFECRDVTITSECGRGRVGPCFSRSVTLAATTICSSSDSVFHQPSNSP